MVGWITRTFDARLPAGGFLRHAFAVSSGVVVSQGITILSTPIITRIYSPSVYGTVITLVASSSILAVIAPFSFQVAISIARDDDEALSLAAIALVLATLFTSFVTIVFLVLPQDVLASVGFDPQLYGLRWLIPVMVITGTYQTVISQFGTYRRAYAALASASATQAIVSGGVKIALGLIAPVAGSLIVGELARRSVGTGLIARRSGLRVHDLLARSTPRRIRATARAFRRYPAFVLPSSLLNTISLQAPVVLLAANFSTVESGLYALGVGVVQLPLSLLQSGVSSAFVSRIREYESTDSLAEVITKMVQVLALLTAPWFALCAVWGPDFMAVVFGAAWRESGTYLALLTPWLFIGFVFSGCSMVLWARDRQGADFGWQVMFVTLRLGAL